MKVSPLGARTMILMTRLRSHLKVSDLFIEIEKDKEPWFARIFRMTHKMRELDE